MDASLASAVLVAQQALVLSRGSEGRLRIEPPAPPWLARVAQWPGPTEDAFDVGDVFPYLEVFLPEAETVWSGVGEGPAHSGIWVESTRDGDTLELEATAIRASSGGVLVIREAHREHAARQSVLQLARVSALEHERLLAELSAKEVLLHCIVHDLAGPLAGMQGCWETLSQAPLGTAEAELVRLGLLQAGRQGRLIQDILDVFATQIASLDRLPPDENLAPDPVACVTEVVEGLRPAFLIKNVGLRVESPVQSPTPWRVVAESARLERVLYNLLENALRFAPRESEVLVRLVDEGPSVRITVVDQGPGVAAEVLPRLFRRFVAGGRRPGKSGVGLFFCRITLERWGGTIGCDSGSDPGACFTVRLSKLSSEAWPPGGFTPDGTLHSREVTS